MGKESLISIPFSRKRQMTMKRSFIVFSAVFFLLIFVFGSAAFFILMGQNLKKTVKEEMIKTVGLERYKIEASVDTKIAMVMMMANSQFVKRYFSDPGNPELEKLAIDDLKAYSAVLSDKTVFWVNDKDKIFYSTYSNPYFVDIESPENYWYNMTLYQTEKYNFNINYNPDLDITNLWLNAPVLDDNGKPVGIVGVGVNLSKFINNIYAGYSGDGDLYFFNSALEITGARNFDLISSKINIEQELKKASSEILEKIKFVKNDDVIFLDLKKSNGMAVLGAIPSLNWYITAVHDFSAKEYLQSGLFILFSVMIIIIFSVFLVFDLFVIKLMEPLYQIINGVKHLSDDYDLSDQNDKTEVETIGELVNMTIIDQLTGIYNRRYFICNMKKIIRSLSRSDGYLSVLMLDVDFFKKYNDTYGHDMGDKCLKKVSAALSKVIGREDDFLARYGGEEFVVVLPNTNENGAVLVAKEMIKAVSDCKIPHKSYENVGIVTVSAGCTTGIVKHSQSISSYVKCADAALYKSKQNGRNCCTFENYTV